MTTGSAIGRRQALAALGASALAAPPLLAARAQGDTTPIRIEFGPDGKVKAKTCAPQASGSERPTGN